MGIEPKQFPIIWEAIRWWMKAKDVGLAKLARLTRYPIYRIEKGIKEKYEWLPSDFVHDCVDVFGLRSSRQRGIEDTADVLTDEECVELLTQPLRSAHQTRLWDNL